MTVSESFIKGGLRAAFIAAAFAIGVITPVFAQHAVGAKAADRTSRIEEMQKMAGYALASPYDTKMDQMETRAIEWQNDGTKFVYTLQLDGEDLARLHSNPVANNLQGQVLVDALRSRGAIYKDIVGPNGNITPAVQEFDIHTGNLIRLEHYQDDKLQDTDAGEAAIVHFDAQTGNKTILEHYQADKLQDPASGEAAMQYFIPREGSRPYILLHYQAGKLQDTATGEPARQLFDSKTGRRIHLAYYKMGAFQDPASGVAAWQKFDAKTGHRIRAEHYQKGRLQDSALGEAAIQDFDAQTGKRTALMHYDNRKLHDPASDEPASQQFDAQTGMIVFAERFKNGISQGILTSVELKALNDRQAGTLALPKLSP